MITIIDYKMGNIRSIINAFQFLGYKVKVSDDSRQIAQADKLVLPGVGSFKQAMSNIKRLELYDIIEEKVKEKKCPILGICLGMQLLAHSSEENGYTLGFSFINDTVKKFNKDIAISVPHIGFNSVNITLHNSMLFSGIEDRSDFYFVHSFRLENIMTPYSAAYANNGELFLAAVEFNHIFGVQFHPEKSQSNGLKLLDNFAKW